MQCGVAKTCPAEHFFILPKGIGITGRGGDQHGEAKSRYMRWRDPVFIGNKLQGPGTAFFN